MEYSAMEDPSNIRNSIIATDVHNQEKRSSYHDSSKVATNETGRSCDLGNKLIKGLVSLRSFMDLNSLQDFSRDTKDKIAGLTKLNHHEGNNSLEQGIGVMRMASGLNSESALPTLAGMPALSSVSAMHPSANTCSSNLVVRDVGTFHQVSCALSYTNGSIDNKNLLAYKPSKITSKAIIPGGSFGFAHSQEQTVNNAQNYEASPSPNLSCSLSLAMGQGKDYAHGHFSANAIGNSQMVMSAGEQVNSTIISQDSTLPSPKSGLWAKVCSTKCTGVIRRASSGSSLPKPKNSGYWSRGRRTLKETADFFKNLPHFNPNQGSAFININAPIPNQEFSNKLSQGTTTQHALRASSNVSSMALKHSHATPERSAYYQSAAPVLGQTSGLGQIQMPVTSSMLNQAQGPSLKQGNGPATSSELKQGNGSATSLELEKGHNLSSCLDSSLNNDAHSILAHELTVEDSSVRIVNRVMAQPYAAPFAKSESEFLSSSYRSLDGARAQDETLHGGSDDGIRTLLGLIEVNEESDSSSLYDKRLDFEAHSSAYQSSHHYVNESFEQDITIQPALFDGQSCSLVDRKLHQELDATDRTLSTLVSVLEQDLDLRQENQGNDSITTVQAEVVGSSIWTNMRNKRSAYKSESSCVSNRAQASGISTSAAHIKERNTKSRNWGNNLYVQLCADNAPPSSSQSSSLGQTASKALSEISQALISLLGFNAVDEARDILLDKDETCSFTEFLLHRPAISKDTGTIIGHSFVLDRKNPLYLGAGQLKGYGPKDRVKDKFDPVKTWKITNFAMDLSNNKEQTILKQDELASNKTELSAPVIANEPVGQELSMRAFSGKNELNTMSSDLYLSRISEKERRLERSLSSYFISNQLNDHCVLGNKKEVQPADTLVYGIFKQWMRRRASVLLPDGTLEEANESALYDIVLILIQTMIFAMRADGRIENDEHQSLVDFCSSVAPKSLYNNIRGEIDRLLTIDLDPSLLAKKVRYPEESLDIYLLSAVLLNNSHFLELGYLENLAACLGIDPSLRRSLDDKAQKIILSYPKLHQSS